MTNIQFENESQEPISEALKKKLMCVATIYAPKEDMSILMGKSRLNEANGQLQRQNYIRLTEGVIYWPFPCITSESDNIIDVRGRVTSSKPDAKVDLDSLVRQVEAVKGIKLISEPTPPISKPAPQAPVYTKDVNLVLSSTTTKKRIYYKGTAEFSHSCDAGWRSHVSTVIVEQVSPRMGVIVDSDGGGPYRGSNRQRYWPQRAANQEIGKKVQLGRVIDNAEKAATYWEALEKALKHRPFSADILNSIYTAISQHKAFTGFQ